ncbi:Solute carrier family 15 member 1 [Collichthys lucidus]|uniref:Solute carrier family 15 member 1 n=1 Tax=Collichthys lucidus TaxID=240159 RepID=A0A4U5TXM0_COLLU|nr:Solute carrier family 15 member 1 [Collichthys lucidus]
MCSRVQQEKQRSTFFSIFYLSINAGSLLSTVITPILRVVFIVGSGMYNKTAPQGNILVKVCKCIGFAIKNRFRHRSSAYPRRAHWMDWAEEKYDNLLIAQVKMVVKVLFLYIPLPMFWALFDQQGSRWTLQATTMNGDFGFLIIQPDQMQTVNPILILALVPIMDSLIYPLITKCKLNFTPLKRMTVGMFLAALAFIVAALVQIQIDETMPQFPSSTQGQAKFINMLDTQLDVKAGPYNITLPPYTANADYLTFDEPFELVMNSTSQLADIPDGNRTTMVIIQGGHSPTHKQFRIFDGTRECTYTQELGFGSSYTLIIPPTVTFPQCQESIRPVLNIERNSVSMAWQIPQYFLITAGEVVFSVTGLEFAYSQAPSNMKSVLQAGWLLTVAVGNIIVLTIAEVIKLDYQWAEYILFASLLILVCIIFAFMAHFYTYIDPAKIEAEFAKKEPEDKKRESLKMDKKDSVEKSYENRKNSDSSSDEDEPSETKM